MIELIKELSFRDPYYLLLWAIIPLIYFFLKRYYKQQIESINLPESGSLLKFKKNWKVTLLPYLIIFRLLAFILFILALARPQLALQEEKVNAEGIDIMLTVDLSSSMLAQDFKPDRLEVCKRVAAQFIDKRKYDRLGLVSFSGEAFTPCPLTSDHDILKEYLANLQCGLLEDGTAIGMGLGTAVNRIKDSDAKSKVVILLTDGVNNAGYLKPITAAEIALKYNVKVYTIGVGTSGAALTPVSRRSDGEYIFGLAQVEIDEPLLREMASLTGGKYYRATNERSLENIYAEIDKLEKTTLEVTRFKRFKDLYFWFAGFALFLLITERLLRITVFRSTP
jgi:Ca-activated chloride channel family protein